jgi:hypothetical protein
MTTKSLNSTDGFQKRSNMKSSGRVGSLTPLLRILALVFFKMRKRVPHVNVTQCGILYKNTFYVFKGWFAQAFRWAIKLEILLKTSTNKNQFS